MQYMNNKWVGGLKSDFSVGLCPFLRSLWQMETKWTKSLTKLIFHCLGIADIEVDFTYKYCCNDEEGNYWKLQYLKYLANWPNKSILKVFYQLIHSNWSHPHVPTELVNILDLLNILPGYQHRFCQAAIVAFLMENLCLMDIPGRLMGWNMVDINLIIQYNETLF